MDYFKDLSYYSRFHFENAQNIGFGQMEQNTDTAGIPQSFMPRLLKYLKYPVNSVRGGACRTAMIDHQQYTLGFSEIRVLDRAGNVYAAPDEIVADIAQGTYLPPVQFIDAVMNGVDPDSEAYRTYLTRYKPEYCWGASNEYVAAVVSAVEAISAGDLEQLKRLLDEQKSLIDIVTGDGSLLNEAITRNREEIALYLLEAGINLEKFEGVELLTAVECGMEKVVAALLERGALKWTAPETIRCFWPSADIRIKLPGIYM